MRADGTGLRRVTRIGPNGAFDAAPRYSPDGKPFVFTRVTLSGQNELPALYVVDIDGRHLHRVTPFRISVGDADWSPGGHRLVFEADTPTAYRSDIFTVRAQRGIT